jgi:hypothetical protein
MDRRSSVIIVVVVLSVIATTFLVSCENGEGTYPSLIGSWQYIGRDPETGFLQERWNITIYESSFENNIWSYGEGWDYNFGLRGSYALSGDEFTSTFTEGSFDGTTWFDSSDTTNWNDLMDMVESDGWTSYYAVSPSGNYFFQYSDVWGGNSVMLTRTSGDAVAAGSSYPGVTGNWEYTDTAELDERWTTSITDSGFETNIYSYETDHWEYNIGMRGTYSKSGDNFTSTFNEASFDGTTWFDSSDTTNWNDFLDSMDSLVWTSTYGMSPSGSNFFQYNDEWGYAVMMEKQ